MQEFWDILLNVWREVCRHTEIAEATSLIAKMVMRELPVDQLLVRSFDADGDGAETIGANWVDDRRLRPEHRTARSERELRELIAWCAQTGTVQKGRPSAIPSPACLSLPQDLNDDRQILVGALWGNAARRGGCLIAIAPGRQPFDARQTRLFRALLDPFSAAVENDRRLRALAEQREAAEADKHSLLIRLGRERLADTIVGGDSGLKEVMERVELVAGSNAPVLLFGETGSGKEVVARAIHTRSARRDGPFVRVNCGAIPTELIDSQLFGHEKGAFTGAVKEHKGWFERSNGGTLLLDEVADLTPAAQVRLLRVLQDGWIDRVGSQHSTHVDVRVVAATHRDLTTMVSEARFREDLWYRLSVFPIVLPPLRRRPEDIAELARHFARRAARRFGLNPILPSEADLVLLREYDWPGNVRELGAIMDRAAILGNGRRLEVAKALGATPQVAATPAGVDGAAVTQSRPAAPAVGTLEDAIRARIQTALAHSAGRVEGSRGAAAILQVHPSTLRARMRKLGIDPHRFKTART